MDRALFLKPSLFLVALVASLGLPATVSQAATTTITGTPLNVYVSDVGNIQAKLDSDTNRVFYPSGDAEGDAGLFVGFPASPLLGSVYGPPGSPFMSATTGTYQPVSQGAITGTGTEADPFQLITAYKVRSGGHDYLTVTQTIKYVNGAKQFSAGYTVANVSSPGVDLRFRATVGADLYIEGDDSGTGLLDPGPPRFLAGVNNSVGRAGGLVEVPGFEWDAYEVTNFASLWSTISNPLGPGLDNTLVDEVTDNGAGVQWSGYAGLGQGLAAGASVNFDTIWRFAAVVPLTLNPAEGTQSAGKPYKIAATATEVTGNPMVGKKVRYTVAGANPGSGIAEAVTDSTGKAYIKYVGNNIGLDTVTVFVDLNDNGVRESNEPKLDAKVTWTAYKPPTPPISASIIERGPYVVSKDGKVEVFLTCPSTAPADSGCEGDLTGRISVRKHAPHKAKKKSKKSGNGASQSAKKKKKKKKVAPLKPGTYKYKIGPVHYKLEPKQNGKVTATVKPETLKRLKKMKRAIVSFTVRTSGKPPQSALGTIRVAK